MGLQTNIAPEAIMDDYGFKVESAGLLADMFTSMLAKDPKNQGTLDFDLSVFYKASERYHAVLKYNGKEINKIISTIPEYKATQLAGRLKFCIQWLKELDAELALAKQGEPYNLSVVVNQTSVLGADLTGLTDSIKMLSKSL